MRLSRETWIGIGTLALTTAAMAVDHLLGTDPENNDSFPVDPAAFFISVGISAVLAAFLFGRVVTRAKSRSGSERAAVYAAVCSGLAVFPGLAFLWLGFPLVLAGGGVALGLLALRGRRRGLATTATALGAIVLVLAAAAYAAGVIRSL